MAICWKCDKYVENRLSSTKQPKWNIVSLFYQDIGITEGEKHVQIQSTDGVLVVDSKGLSRHHE